MKHRINRRLKVGDRIKVWWSNERQATPNVATITSLKKYDGPLAYLWPKGARLAEFMESRVGMTMPNNSYSEVV